ncbi:MAG: ribonuclease III [Luminiphilus sp.]|jgi:ribonuclease-3
MKPKHAALQRTIGYQFQEPALLVRALTHRSFGADNNERLEFIGDGLVNAVVAELLFSHYPDLDEGSLSRLRSKLVSKEGLATLAERFELGPLVLLGAGERKSGGRHRASIMADTVEALAGGMLVEAGFGMASEIVASWFVADIASLDIHTTRDAKTRLQEWLQGKGYPLPAYEVIAIFGDDHNQIFEVACSCKAAESRQVGTASSRKKAEQKAAEAMLEILENE